MFNRIIAAVLVSALAFGQVGAGFLHNKHDAHEAVVDLDSNVPVLLNHGEHCKVCAIDWVHQFDSTVFAFDVVNVEFDFLTPADVTSTGDFILLLKSSRAPPVL
jgi:hypothetical protein